MKIKMKLKMKMKMEMKMKKYICTNKKIYKINIEVANCYHP